MLTSVTFSFAVYSSQSVWPESSVTCSHLSGVWIREKRAGRFGLWAGSAGKDEKKMWAWVKECCCKQTSFAVPVIQRASSQQLPATAGPVVCLVGLFGYRCEALLPITMIP